jgi:hypothetical protein
VVPRPDPLANGFDLASTLQLAAITLVAAPWACGASGGAT